MISAISQDVSPLRRHQLDFCARRRSVTLVAFDRVCRRGEFLTRIYSQRSFQSVLIKTLPELRHWRSSAWNKFRHFQYSRVWDCYGRHVRRPTPHQQPRSHRPAGGADGCRRGKTRSRRASRNSIPCSRGERPVHPNHSRRNARACALRLRARSWAATKGTEIDWKIVKGALKVGT